MTVTVVRGDGHGTSTRQATRAGDGTWTVDVGVLQPGDRVEVRAGDVRDQAGNTNADAAVASPPPDRPPRASPAGA